MKKTIILGALVIPCFLYCMDIAENNRMVSRTRYFRPIKAEVEKRHDVGSWHVKLTNAVVLNQQCQISQMLVDAGKDAPELICTALSVYGPILRVTYVENKPEIRKLLKNYMDEEYFKKCFEQEILKLENLLMPSKYVNRISPAAEELVRDFHIQDPIKYPLSLRERQKLNIK